MNQNKLQVSGQFLYSFTAVAKHMSFTKAAEELCITQSAVSHRIRCLEQELGFPLFHRLTRKIILTEEGKTLYGALDVVYPDNTTEESVEFIYELSGRYMNKQNKAQTKSITDAVYEIGNIEYLNIVRQNDDISG